jgi:hypothetical protein
MTTDVAEIEELAERARIAQESAELRAGSAAGGIFDKKVGEMVKDISDPTHLVTIYHAESGEPRRVPAWTLEPTSRHNLLLRKEPNGRNTFVTKAPKGKWQKGDVPCLLSASHPDRERYRQMGLRTFDCNANNLASLYDQRTHMAGKHRKEWALIQEAEQKEREAEEREFRRAQMAVAQKALEAK